MVDNANVTQAVRDAFAGVTGKRLRYAIAKCNGADIELADQGERAEGLDELRAKLGSDPCYILFDFEATKDDGAKLLKTCFIKFSPDSCTNMAQKMALQNYGNSVKNCVNVNKEMQINDLNDLTEGEFRDAFNL